MSKFGKIAAFFLLFMLTTGGAHSFCGFYVAQAGAKLFNKTSQVIVARKDNRNVVTMANDFQGDVKNFAIVVPVPVVLQQKDVRVLSNELFAQFDAYSAPRLVEYWDPEPCMVYEEYEEDDEYGDDGGGDTETATPSVETQRAKALGIKIESKFSVGEYDILILSATQSDGLTLWLNENKYSLPPAAKEVLEPYIKNKLKFFVVKVNLAKFNESGFAALRPLQIEYDYPKFMLPIRLGMANANGDQDLVIYCLSDVGRVETVNYRTAPMPTDKNVPLSTQGMFASFYQSVFEKAWTQEGKTAVMLEYFWDISGFEPVKCDPCPGPVLVYDQLKEAGAFWIQPTNSGGYDGPLYFTRLHARYNRQLYPQDLMFQATANHENFQVRYVMNHPAQGPFDCEAGKPYLTMVEERQKEEWRNFRELTGWGTKENDRNGKNELPFALPTDDTPGGGGFDTRFLYFGLALALVLAFLLVFDRGLHYLTAWLKPAR